MPRTDIRETLYQDLVARNDLLALLGPVTAQNARIYSAFPQTQPQLTGIEPDEGWLAVTEEETIVYWQTVQQRVVFLFAVYATRLTLGDDVIDILDDLYHWKLGGQNSRNFGEWRVIRSQRLDNQCSYNRETNLYYTGVRYQFYISGLRRG